MIYINQIGAGELGRGETLQEAIEDACRLTPILESEINRLDQINTLADGEIYWTSTPMPGYNGVSHYEIELQNDLGDRLFWNTDGFSDDPSRDRDTFDTRADAEWELRNELRDDIGRKHIGPSENGYQIFELAGSDDFRKKFLVCKK